MAKSVKNVAPYVVAKVMEFIPSCWKATKNGFNDKHVDLRHNGIYARDFGSDSLGVIELKHHYNGSGGDAFGGADHWPALDASFSFPEGREDLAVKFAQRLAVEFERFAREHKLAHVKAEV